MSGSKNVTELTETTSPVGTDLVYISKRGTSGSFSDRKSKMTTVKNFSRTDKTIARTGDFAIVIGQCDKRWFSNRNAVSTITITLPTAVDGKEVGVLLEVNQKIIIKPQATDMITPITIIDGESIECSTIGNNVYLRGYTDGWYIVSQEGTWIVSV